MAILRASCLLAVLLLCGCAPTTVDPGRTQMIKRVAVISAIGDKFTMKKIGITVFGNEEKEFSIDAWRVDEFVIGKVRAVLAGRYDVRPVSYQKAAFNTKDGAQAVAEVVRSQSTSPDIDAYIVVTKGSANYRNSNQYVYGLGVVERAGLGDSAFHLHVIYWITVVDGHNYSVIASAPAVPLSQTLLAVTDAIGGLSRQIDKSWLPESTDPAQNLRLKGAVTELLDRNLPGTIESLKLLQ
jgi:hypothetical protein